MTKNYKQLTQDISAYIGELKKEAPEVISSFQAMNKGAITPGALDSKTKELIALAIGVSQRCDGCIGFHTKALHKFGATRQEVAETLATCVYMGGGPVLMYAADALRAFDEFATE